MMAMKSKTFAERNTDETDDVSIKKDQQAFYRIGYDKFLKEAHILGTLQNMKSVVAVRDWFEKNNTAYIAMEFIHGSTIDRYVKRHKVTEKRILEMLKQTIQELGQIHQLGILYRDISPGNLIVEDDGNIKLIDFGSAINLGQRRDGRTNTVMYNPDFAAPEQYDPNGHIGPWTDVYGVSAVIFYLLTGETVSKGKEVQKQPDIPRWQKDILMRGLSPSVELRIQSMAEFYARLYDAPLPEEIRKQEEQRKRQRKVILFRGIAAILLNVNCWYGLPLGDGYRYQLKYDGFHVIDLAVRLSENGESDLANINRIGEGWVAEETLGIAIYCALRHQDDFSAGVIASVNHKGDSDSTGAVTGNILGALLGFDAIEEKWKTNLELIDVIIEMADDLCHGCQMSEYGHYENHDWVRKYIDMQWKDERLEAAGKTQ